MPKIHLEKWQFWLLSLALVLLVGVALKANTVMQQITRSGEQIPPNSEQTSSHSTSLSQDNPPQSQTEAIYQTVNPAVVTIYTDQVIGSGSIVRSDGLILTNRHVVQTSPEVKVKTATEQMWVGKVIDLDLRYDLALVQLQPAAHNLPIVTLADTVTLKPGDPVFAIGSPAGKSGVLTTGTFTQITQHGSLQLSAGLLKDGNSGGPLLNQQGEMIGINKGVLPDQSGLATSVAAAKALIQRHDVIYQRQTPTIPSPLKPK
ncbi:S1C family serine protease [Pantanalinema rosaneae CENA516]|uniref:S1C family serine protease n=1 Tax=Pantanalinema rosaneae TaxID=1620701 RepID=UPI003D6F95F3